MEKNSNYFGFFEQNRYFVIPVALTTRGTCGFGANETLDLLIEFSKRKKKKLNIGQFKKEIMCAMKKSDSLMKDVFYRKIHEQVRIDYKNKKHEIMMSQIDDDEPELQQLSRQY
jgi:uncharacterized protein YfeS